MSTQVAFNETLEWALNLREKGESKNEGIGILGYILVAVGAILAILLLWWIISYFTGEGEEDIDEEGEEGEEDLDEEEGEEGDEEEGEDIDEGGEETEVTIPEDMVAPTEDGDPSE